MKIGVLTGFTAATSSALITATGDLLDQSGLHEVWVPEHVLFFERYAQHYPAFGEGKSAAIRAGLVDPFVALTFLAGCTERIRLGTAVCLVPQRNPVYTAKQVADIDFLSGSRLDFGVGVGWLRAELEAVGERWEDRGARTSEAIELMKTLWGDDISRHSGAHYDLPESLMYPKPRQQPHPPIYVGGHSDAALRRVAALGDGWFGFNLDAEVTRSKLNRLDELMSATGRTIEDVDIVVAPEGLVADADTVARYRDLGVDQLVVLLHARDRDGLKRAIDGIRQLADN